MSSRDADVDGLGQQPEAEAEQDEVEDDLDHDNLGRLGWLR
jgi:hypothetical protein